MNPQRKMQARLDSTRLVEKCYEKVKANYLLEVLAGPCTSGKLPSSAELKLMDGSIRFICIGKQDTHDGVRFAGWVRKALAATPLPALQTSPKTQINSSLFRRRYEAS